MAPNESPRPRPRERNHHHERRRASRNHAKSRHESSSSQSGSQLLSANALAKLNQLNQQQSVRPEEVTPTKTRRKRHREIVDEKLVVDRSRRQHKRKRRRVVSGALLEEGDSYRLKGFRGGEKYEEYGDGKRKKRLCRPFFYLILYTKSDFLIRDVYWCSSCSFSHYHCGCSGCLPEEQIEFELVGHKLKRTTIKFQS